MHKSKPSQLLLLMFIMLAGCNADSNKSRIIGKWEATLSKMTGDPVMDAMTKNRGRLVITFNKDMTLVNEIIRSGEETSTNTGTYDFEKDEKHLVVYREGMKDRKNVAEIIELTSTSLGLVDISGSGDTLMLKKVK